MGAKRWTVKIVPIALAIAVAGFVSGIAYERVTSEPLVQTVIREVLVGVPVEVPVVVEVEKVVEVAVVVEKPLELRDFESEEELGRWIEDRERRQVLFLKSGRYDCDNAALTLAEDAMDDGYRVWVQIVDGRLKSPVSGEIVNRLGKVHALNSTIIGNDYYYIEPSLNEYWPMWLVD